ncbi:hypothetical protein C8Q77DRAFT_1850 [Trametes polyzona]|nr:hypothetical protein C8Q77DRAFT_1850 [Trametes polyzona]
MSYTSPMPNIPPIVSVCHALTQHMRPSRPSHEAPPRRLDLPVERHPPALGPQTHSPAPEPKPDRCRCRRSDGRTVSPRTVRLLPPHISRRANSRTPSDVAFRGPAPGAVGSGRSPRGPMRTLSDASVHRALEDVTPAAFSRLAALLPPGRPRRPSHVGCHLMRCSSRSGSAIPTLRARSTAMRRPHSPRTACARLGMPRRGPDEQFA